MPIKKFVKKWAGSENPRRYHQLIWIAASTVPLRLKFEFHIVFQNFKKGCDCLALIRLFLNTTFDYASGVLYVPRNWAFASTLCRPSICGQWLWTICTNCWGFTSFCISAGLGSRNFVSFNVGDWTMSAARCKRAASRHTSNCNKWLEKIYTIVYSLVKRTGSVLGRRGRWHGGEEQIYFSGTTINMDGVLRTRLVKTEDRKNLTDRPRHRWDTINRRV